jgi:hypothetical protein
MKTQLIFYILLISFVGNSQLSESFSDGNFTTNPTWNGTTGDYIVNTNFELQTNLAVAATSYLSVPHSLTSLDGKEWRVRVKQSFSPSSSNFGKIYLTAAGSDPLADPDGFYLQLGEAGSVDAVHLFKRESGVSTLICSGTSGSIANSFNYGIRVTRDNSGLWSLYTDALGGTNYIFDSSGTDTAPLLGTHFIWQCTYTSSNANKFYLDDVYAGNLLVDNIAPKLISAVAINQNAIDVLFDEPLNQAIAEDVNNYDIQPFLSATTAILDAGNPKLVHLTPISPLTNGSQYTLIVNYMEDLLGNDTLNQTTTFNYFIPENPSPGDVIITEIFADPSPVIGLPELELVEIYNRSTKFFDLNKWKLGDASSDGTVQTSILAPGEYRVLCATASVPSFTGSAGVTSFPSLNNAGDDVVLKDTNGIIIDKVSYTDLWYQNTVKKDGGYTLELINPTLICSSSTNWVASNSASGGTPGAQNSVFNNAPDLTAPNFTNIYALAPNVVTIQFNEPMDASTLATASFSTQPTTTELNRFINGTQPNEVSFLLSPDLVPSQTYTFTLGTVKDCAGNSLNLTNGFVLPDNPVNGDVVINEILFDPLTGGSDYVEIYNVSSKVLDLFEWQLANISGDTIANKKKILTHKILNPGDYVVITKDPANVIANYPVAVANKIIQSELPSYNTDEGTVIIKTDFTVIDSVAYKSSWHFQLLDSKKGKSLERINALDGSNNPSNWHTAAEGIGFGTPGKENSQFVPYATTGEFSFPNKVFSPDNDGFEDVLQIRYEMKVNELLANIQIFDVNGRLVRKLKESEYLGTDGVFTWDGVNDEGTKASIGQYIVVFEAFQPNGGTTFVDRKVCVLAGKL